jgi:integrase
LQPEARIALWLCLSTACRIGELLQAEWKHVDLDAGTWFIPVENVKGTRGKKQEHRIYLSDFARSQFRALHAINGKGPWCFPSRDGKTHLDLKTVTKQVGDRQHRFKQRGQLSNRRNDDSLVLAQGRNGEWTPHDLRRTAATMMQALGVAPDVIDRCQNHVIAGSRVRRHYLTHEYAAESKDAWQRLGKAIQTAIARHGRHAPAINPPEPDRPRKLETALSSPAVFMTRHTWAPGSTPASSGTGSTNSAWTAPSTVRTRCAGRRRR